MEAGLQVKIDHTKIKGMTELLMAADALVAPGADKEACISKVRAAMMTIGENFKEGDLADAVTVTSNADGKPDPVNFYHMNGTAAVFDIDEDLGQLILACDRALDFIHNGPILGAPQKVIDELYQIRVINLMPKVRAIVENRITVLLPYSKLVDDSFTARHNVAPDKKFSELDRIRTSTCRLSYVAEELAKRIAMYDPAGKEPIPAPAVMEHLAMCVEDMQQTMTAFGWTWDDVKLASRKQIAALYEPKAT